MNTAHERTKHIRCVSTFSSLCVCDSFYHSPQTKILLDWIEAKSVLHSQKKQQQHKRRAFSSVALWSNYYENFRGKYEIHDVIWWHTHIRESVPVPVCSCVQAYSFYMTHEFQVNAIGLNVASVINLLTSPWGHLWIIARFWCNFAIICMQTNFIFQFKCKSDLQPAQNVHLVLADEWPLFGMSYTQSYPVTHIVLSHTYISCMWINSCEYALYLNLSKRAMLKVCHVFMWGSSHMRAYMHISTCCCIRLHQLEHFQMIPIYPWWRKCSIQTCNLHRLMCTHKHTHIITAYHQRNHLI